MKAGDEIVLHEKVTIDDWLLDDRKKNLYTFNNNFSARHSVSADRVFFFVWLLFWLKTIMAQSVEVLSEKMQEMNLTNEVFYGEDLSSEENFLKALIESIIENFEQYEEVSYYFKKKSMAFSFWSLIMPKEAIKKHL